MKEVLKKITDIATIVFPAVIAVLGVLDLTGVVQILDTVQKIFFIALGALSAASSVVFNKVSK